MNPTQLLTIFGPVALVASWCLFYRIGHKDGVRGKDNAWNEGYLIGAREVGLTRDNSGRFRSLKQIGRQTPVGSTRKLEFQP